MYLQMTTMVVYNPEDFEEFDTTSILVDTSVVETLYRLEEARFGLREVAKPAIYDALDFLYENMMDYGGHLIFSYTEYDEQKKTTAYIDESGKKRIKTLVDGYPTCERYYNSWLQTPFTVLYWEDRKGEEVQMREVMQNQVMNFYPLPKLELHSWGSEGYWCCTSCTLSGLSVLRYAEKEIYETREEQFLKFLHTRRMETGRWKDVPFYWSILTFKDLGTDTLDEELKWVAERVQLSRLRFNHENPRVTAFRNHVKEILESYK